MKPIFLILSFTLATLAATPENAGNKLATALLPCYNTTEFRNKNMFPPVTMNVAIELIRKLENGPSRFDARQLSAIMLQTFRQDGIINYGTSKPMPGVIPYSPLGIQASKNKLLLSKFIPYYETYKNDAFNQKETCSLHYMMSNTILKDKRGDEGFVCSNMGRYVQRVRRAIPDDEVEVLQQNHNTFGRIQDNPDVEIKPNARRVSGELSECPLEDGVVYTRWGAVQFGTVIAGIATGLQNQAVQCDSCDTKVPSNSIYAATIAGDIAELAVKQAPKGIDVDAVGANGGWNSTYEPRYYFISKTLKDNNDDYYMTDAEIRANIDGFIFANYVEDWRKKFGTIKISQLLDMFYSQRGVFSSDMKACRRKELATSLLKYNELQKESYAFSLIYQELFGDITADGQAIQNFTSEAITRFIQYAKELNDLSCKLENPVVRAAVDLTIILDTALSYELIGPTISYLLDNLDINNIDGSNVTIINGADGSIILNSTSSLWDFYEQYNYTVHFNSPRGFKFTDVFNNIEVITKRKINEDKAKGNVGGKTVVFLLMPESTPTDNDKKFIQDRLVQVKSTFPDFRMLVAGKASKDAYSDVVFDSTYDVFQLSTDKTGISNAMKPVIEKIKQYERRISNPRCGSDWTQEVSADTLDQFIEPNTTNYYRIASNYIFGEKEKTLKVRGTYGNLMVCTSRDINTLKQKDFQGDDCQSINGGSEVTFTLTGACKDQTYIADCPPYYIGVRAKDTKDYSCTDTRCRFPDNIKYSITIEGFECASSSSAIYSSFILISIVALLTKYF